MSLFEYSFSSLPEHFFGDNKDPTTFFKALCNGWESCRKSGALRYDVEHVSVREVEGAYSYVLLLNPERASNRRTPEVSARVKEAFDPNKFHFSRVSENEIILRLKNVDIKDEEQHSILVNVSPIMRFHSLLCPYIHRNLPQIVTQESIQLILHVYCLAQNPSMWIGFNSLCALASVNHLHYHLFMKEGMLPVERAKCRHLVGPVYTLDDTYPARAFCFHLANKTDIDATSCHVFKLVQFLLDENIAHNLAVTTGLFDGRLVVRISVWARRNYYGPKQFSGFNVAVCELSGFLPVFDEQLFQNLQASEIDTELRSWMLKDFENLTRRVVELYR